MQYCFLSDFYLLVLVFNGENLPFLFKGNPFLDLSPVTNFVIGENCLSVVIEGGGEY